MKTELKDIHYLKSYGQKKIKCEILAISFKMFLVLHKTHSNGKCSQLIKIHKICLLNTPKQEQEKIAIP